MLEPDDDDLNMICTNLEVEVSVPVEGVFSRYVTVVLKINQ